MLLSFACHYQPLTMFEPYIIIEGRCPGTQVYCTRDRVYQKKSDIELGVRLRCAKDCPAEAYICKNLKKVVLDKPPHRCDPDPLERDEIHFRNHLKRLVTVRLDLTVPDCYRSAVASKEFKEEIISRVELASVKPNLSRIRKKFLKELKKKEAPPASGQASKEARTTTNCTICLNELSGNPWINIQCGHGFHRKCSDSAFKVSRKCAICRYHLFLIF